MPLISVVVPVFNGERYLEACLRSIGDAVQTVAAADRAEVEVVLCDNHSTDRSLQLAERAGLGCATRIVQPARHEANRTRNWAHGLSEARGEWMQMLHADDQLSARGLTEQLTQVRSRSSRRASLVSGRHRTFEHEGERGALHVRWPLPALLNGRRLAESVLPLHCTLVPFTLMRRSAYHAVGGLDDRWQLVQDWELWMRLAQTGDVLVHAGEVGRWRLHPTSPAYRAQNADEHVALASSLGEIVPGLGARVARRAREASRARAALQLAGLDQGQAPALADLPDVASARRTLRANALEASARLYALRAAGTARRTLAR